MQIIIVGAGIGGLATALSLHAAGLPDVTVLEAADRLDAVGAGVNIQPAASRELFELGLAAELGECSVATSSLEYHHRYGGRIWAEPRGLAAGYNWPQLSIHRGELQRVLLAAVRERLGDRAVHTSWPVRRFHDDGTRVVAFGRDLAQVLQADVLIAADGVNSTIRAALYPHEGAPRSNGITMWRGLSRVPAYADHRTMMVVGCNTNSKMVLYPISLPDGDGLCTLNWVVETHTPYNEVPVAPEPSDVTAYLPGWRHPEVDLLRVIESCEYIHHFPMIDRDPLPTWVRGCTVLLGDAAHPMYPTGSNGASQAIIDARVLAGNLAAMPVDQALAEFDRVRRPQTTALLEAHRRLEPDATLHRVETLAPQGFSDISAVIPIHELAALGDTARQVSGVTPADVNAASPAADRV